MSLQVRIGVLFVAEKRLQRLCVGLLRLFCCDCLPADPPSAWIARTVTDRKRTEYCLSTGFGDSVKIRNNRPLLWLAFAISQRA